MYSLTLSLRAVFYTGLQTTKSSGRGLELGSAIRRAFAGIDLDRSSRFLFLLADAHWWAVAARSELGTDAGRNSARTRAPAGCQRSLEQLIQRTDQ